MVKLNVGAVVLAVGSDVFDASEMFEFGYGRFPNVISNLEFERISDASGPTGGKIASPRSDRPLKNIAFVQCVGSRDKRFHDYCCRVGCMVSLKQAILAREKLGKDVNIYVCYNDMRAFGKGYEEFYTRARDLDINFVAGIPSDIRSAADGSLYFDLFERSTNKLLEVHADMVVLANGLVPNPDIERINELFHACQSSDGFLLEAHPKLRPLESSTAGVFLAGACQGPKDIPDTVAQASGAAAKVVDLLSKGEIELEPLRAIVDSDKCSGCRVCESVCPFSAIEMKPAKEGAETGAVKAEVVEASCQGCGACSASCPTKAIKMQQYGADQVLAEVETAFSKEASGGEYA
jgi:heterodisulfide reductase subunit A